MVSDEFRRRAELAHEAAGHPVRNISAYYTLYHLANVEGIDRVRYDWNQHRDMLYKGLYWYGVSALTRELSNVAYSFYLNGESAFSLAQDAQNGDRRRVVRRFGRRVAERYCPEYRNALSRFVELTYMKELPVGSSIDALADYFRALDREGGVLADPQELMTFIYTFFSNAPVVGEGIDPAEPDRFDTGWDRGFAGPLWTQIARHMTRHDTSNPTVWVDTCLGLQHNAGNWLDKARWADADKAPLAGAHDVMRDATVQSLLDAGAEGNVKQPAAVALQYADYFDFNLRRILNDLWGHGWDRDRAPVDFDDDDENGQSSLSDFTPDGGQPYRRWC